MGRGSDCGPGQTPYPRAGQIPAFPQHHRRKQPCRLNGFVRSMISFEHDHLPYHEFLMGQKSEPAWFDHVYALGLDPNRMPRAPGNG